MLSSCACAQDNRIWATYFGGNDWDIADCIATDANGNVYVAGSTKSTSGIAAGGFQNTYGGGSFDIFLVKYDATGLRLWSTYYGGNGDDRPSGVIVDNSGNIYVTGFTSSASGISSGGFQNSYGGGNYDALLLKFNAAGTRLWATYYGGPGTDSGSGLALDASGNIYMSAGTDHTANMASGGFQNTYGGGSSDGLLVKFSPAGIRIWATYYGGSASDGATGVAIDLAGNIFLAGVTQSTSAIAFGGFQNVYSGGAPDGFLVKFNPAGNRIWATYYGGTGMDYGGWPVTDHNGNVYMAGITNSPAGIATTGAYQTGFAGGVWDAYVVKFDYSGSRIWGTYYGGVNTDEPENISVNDDGYIFLGGGGYSPGMASGGFQNTLIGTENQFVAKFDSIGNMVCATYYGQQHEEEGVVAAFGNGIVYLAGGTESASGIASGGFQNSYGGGVYDGFLVKFSTCGPPMNLSAIGSDQSCNNFCNGTGTAVITGGIGPYTYSWNSVPVQTTATATGLCAGTYIVTVTDASLNSLSDTILISAPSPLSLTMGSTPTSCSIDSGAASSLVNGGTPPYTYLWSNGATTASIAGLTAGTYGVVCTDANGCTITQTTVVNYLFPPPVINVSNDTSITFPSSASLFASGATNYSWSPPDGLSCISCPDPFASPLSTTTYCVIGSDTNGCSDTACVSVEVHCDAIFIPNAFSPNNDEHNDILFVRSHCLDVFVFRVYDRWGEKVFESNNLSSGWDGNYNGAPALPGVYVYYIDAELSDGTSVIQKGNVTLIR